MKKIIIAATIIVALITATALAMTGPGHGWIHGGSMITSQMGSMMTMAHMNNEAMHGRFTGHVRMDWDQMNQGKCLVKS